jgi:hypothetical protein
VSNKECELKLCDSDRSWIEVRLITPKVKSSGLPKPRYLVLFEDVLGSLGLSQNVVSIGMLKRAVRLVGVEFSLLDVLAVGWQHLVPSFIYTGRSCG